MRLRLRRKHHEPLAPILSDRHVVARHPVALLRVVVLCVIGSLLLTAVFVWGIQGQLDERRGVRDRQYQQTRRELDRQRERVAELEDDQDANEKRLTELERRLRASGAQGSSPSPRADGTAGSASRPRPSTLASSAPRSSTTPRSPGPTPSRPVRPTPSPLRPPPADDPDDDPLLCLPLIGCLF